jgi:hypothetical protein
VVQSFKTTLIQLGYRDSEDQIVGASVLGNLKRIGKEFQCSKIMDHANYVNLGSYARKRMWSKVVQLTLGENLDKLPAVRLSKWSKKELSSAQKQYAALDAMTLLEVYERLCSLQDLML